MAESGSVYDGKLCERLKQQLGYLAKAFSYDEAEQYARQHLALGCPHCHVTEKEDLKKLIGIEQG